MCAAYRPPDTKLSEFSSILKSLDNTLSSLPTPAPTVVLMGDFNFGHRAIKWTQIEEGHLVPKVAGYNEKETVRGKQDRLQAQKLVDLDDKHFLLQEEDSPTHISEVIDPVFINICELVSSVDT